MGIGASIFLIAVGAILTFALDVSVGGINLDVVGWILMVAGVIGLIFTAMIWGPRRRTAVTEEPSAYEPADRSYTRTSRTTVTEEPEGYDSADPRYTRSGRTTGYRRTEEHTEL